MGKSRSAGCSGIFSAVVLGTIACVVLFSFLEKPGNSKIIVGVLTALVLGVVVVKATVRRANEEQKPERVSRSTRDRYDDLGEHPGDQTVVGEDGLTLTIGLRGGRDNFFTKIAGVSHFSRAVKQAREGDPLRLVPEPSNPYDPNAVMIISDRTNDQLGYLNRKMAEFLTRQMASGMLYSARIEKLTGGGFKDRGINIQVWLSGCDESKLPVQKEPVKAPNKRRPRAKKVKTPDEPVTEDET